MKSHKELWSIFQEKEVPEAIAKKYLDKEVENLKKFHEWSENFRGFMAKIPFIALFAKLFSKIFGTASRQNIPPAEEPAAQNTEIKAQEETAAEASKNPTPPITFVFKKAQQVKESLAKHEIEANSIILKEKQKIREDPEKGSYHFTASLNVATIIGAHEGASQTSKNTPRIYLASGGNMSLKEFNIQEDAAIKSRIVAAKEIEAIEKLRNEQMEQTLNIGAQCANGVSFVNHAGITHNDMKPENFVADAETKKISLIDFDLSIISNPPDGALQADAAETNQRAGLNAPQYCASPEQILLLQKIQEAWKKVADEEKKISPGKNLLLEKIQDVERKKGPFLRIKDLYLEKIEKAKKKSGNAASAYLDWLNNEVAKLEKNLAVFNDEIAALNNEVADLEKDLTALNNELAALKKDLVSILTPAVDSYGFGLAMLPSILFGNDGLEEVLKQTSFVHPEDIPENISAQEYANRLKIQGNSEEVIDRGEYNEFTKRRDYIYTHIPEILQKLNGKRPENLRYSNEMMACFEHLMKSCMDPNPENRPTLAQVGAFFELLAAGYEVDNPQAVMAAAIDTREEDLNTDAAHEAYIRYGIITESNVPVEINPNAAEMNEQLPAVESAAGSALTETSASSTLPGTLGVYNLIGSYDPESYAFGEFNYDDGKEDDAHAKLTASYQNMPLYGSISSIASEPDDEVVEKPSTPVTENMIENSNSNAVHDPIKVHFQEEELNKVQNEEVDD
ncbi:MAG: hypothetical protein LBT64_03465 [Puniceicoccales bacterium]|nr:hypothetical protein [Puniceicoccales bacterium]